MYEPYRELAAAVVRQAAADYRKARRKLERYPQDEAARQTIRDVELFLHSKWYACLTTVSGPRLLARLKEESK